MVAGDGDCRTAVVAGQLWLHKRRLLGMVIAGGRWLQDSGGSRGWWLQDVVIAGQRWLQERRLQGMVIAGRW
jgi:hypothetical protein